MSYTVPIPTFPLTDEQVAKLREWYTADTIPPCRVCGAELGIAKMGGGEATEWACQTAEARQSVFDFPKGDDHYGKSKYTQYRSGDSQVLALLDWAEEVMGYFK